MELVKTISSSSITREVILSPYSKTKAMEEGIKTINNKIIAIIISEKLNLLNNLKPPFFQILIIHLLFIV